MELAHGCQNLDRRGRTGMLAAGRFDRQPRQRAAAQNVVLSGHADPEYDF
jgi:hypothetical protein